MLDFSRSHTSKILKQFFITQISTHKKIKKQISENMTFGLSDNNRPPSSILDCMDGKRSYHKCELSGPLYAELKVNKVRTKIIF